MKIVGKIESKKITRNNIFCIIKNRSNELIQLVLKKDSKKSYQNQEINIGDVIECEVIEDKNNNSKYRFNGESYEVISFSFVSRNIKNLKFSPNIIAIKKYALIKEEARAFLNSNGYIEVSVPILMDDEISSKSQSFVTTHSKSGKKLFLRKSMDPFLRILSCSGFDNIYCLGEIYRNEYVTALRQPTFEMLSIFSNYISKEEAIDLCFRLLKYLKFIDNKNQESEFNIEEDYLPSSNRNAKLSKNKKLSNEFKIKYKNSTVIHGVDEICDIDEYLQMLSNQGKNESIGDLKLLRDCIASGAKPCYNVGISLQRLLMLRDNLKIDDINPFPFSRIKLR